MIVLAILCLSFFSVVKTNDCEEKITKYGRICVCNATYCDTFPKWKMEANKYHVFTTSSKRLGFQHKVNDLLLANQTLGSTAVTIEVLTNQTFQKVIGFGGAFTDSAGWNINNLSPEAQQKLLESYFGEDGIEYNVCRVPIGGTDFSSRPYSYDDHPFDESLDKFSLQNDDFEYKIKHILQAIKLLTNKRLKLIATAWTAPPWMKTNYDWTGAGELLAPYYQLWAYYHLKFFEEYRKVGIEFWGMTTGNEPFNGLLPRNISILSAMAWLPLQINNWIGYYLGPAIKISNFRHLKVIVHDDNRQTLGFLALQIENDLTLKYIHGVAVHWYGDSKFPDSFLYLTKSTKKNLFLLNTEACNGFRHFKTNEASVMLGSWERGENYADSILRDFNFGANGWMDWNLVLNLEGGPTYINNFVDSPIIVNRDTDEFYKQPMYYVFGHFSKFLIPGSVRCGTWTSYYVTDFKIMAFLRPDGVTVLILFNSGNDDVNIQVVKEGEIIEEVVGARSINTILY